MHGKMEYMENHFDKRLNPTLLVDDAKSVVSLLYNYYTEQTQNTEAPKISKYAYGKDYHDVIKEKLKEFLNTLKEKIGLGWIGKNANLINKQQGSFFFIAELIIDIELEYDGPIQDYCGTCTKCIDACPTEAIVEPFFVDGSKCISYLTIELKDAIPNEFKNKMDNWAFGCDVCQDVCPWNRFSLPHNETQFHNQTGLLDLTTNEWHELTEETFNTIFKHSAVKRTKYKGLKRNLEFIKIIK
jgi:epoxyqueuosine reductase